MIKFIVLVEEYINLKLFVFLYFKSSFIFFWIDNDFFFVIEE